MKNDISGLRMYHRVMSLLPTYGQSQWFGNIATALDKEMSQKELERYLRELQDFGLIDVTTSAINASRISITKAGDEILSSLEIELDRKHS